MLNAKYNFVSKKKGGGDGKRVHFYLFKIATPKNYKMLIIKTAKPVILVSVKAIKFNFHSKDHNKYIYMS